VSEETRKGPLGHKNGDITTHYSAAELAELITAVNRIDRSLETPAIVVLTAVAWKLLPNGWRKQNGLGA